MPTIQVQKDGETLEYDVSDVTLPENYDLVSPDNANSKGYFTQAQLNAKAKEINKEKVSKAKKDLKNDDDFLKSAASEKWGISFTEEGKPKGLKPEVDVDEVRKQAVESVKGEYESQLEETQSKASTYKERLIEQSILSATKGQWQESYTKPQDDGRVKPIVVNQYKNLWDIDDRGKVALKDQTGEGFAVGPKGQHISPDEYLANRDKFGDYMVDTRQKGSGFQQGGRENGKPVFTEQEIENMSEKDFAKNEDAIMEAMAEGRIQK